MIALSKRNYVLVWKLVEYIFLIIRRIYVKAFVAKEANKLYMQVKIGIRLRRAEITYFEINRLCAYVKQIIFEGIHF